MSIAMSQSLRMWIATTVISLLGIVGAVPTYANSMLIRIAEVQIEPPYFDEYLAILREEAEASIRLEPGVISIFPMLQKDDPTKVRILEIYASRGAYEEHLTTAHFKKYKATTMKMVKSLALVDMQPVDVETMTKIFSKAGVGK